MQQIAFADKVLLNKTDLVTGAEKAAVIARIQVMAIFFEACDAHLCSLHVYHSYLASGYVQHLVMPTKHDISQRY